MRYEILAEAASSRYEPGNRLPSDVTVLFETRINFFTVCFGKSTLVLLTLFFRPWALRFPKICAGVRGSYCKMDARWPRE